jgi:hypothetical protein
VALAVIEKQFHPSVTIVAIVRSTGSFSEHCAPAHL